MFTGLVAERGRVAVAGSLVGSDGWRLEIEHSAELGRRLEIGASLAVNGVCLTLVDGSAPTSSVVELSPETLERTTLGRLGVGSEVNLEPALRLGDPLGGHWVQGHVDTTTEVVGSDEQSDFRVVRFRLPQGLEAFVVEKGSVTLDGVSLTVTETSETSFGVALIPHTLSVTTLGRLKVGSAVNLEVDVLAKYACRAVAAYVGDGRPAG